MNMVIEREGELRISCYKNATFAGTEPQPTEMMQWIGVSGHKICASLMATMAGLFATIAPSCHLLISETREEKESKKIHERPHREKK